MKPKIYKRFGRWNLVRGDQVETVWLGDGGEMSIALAMRYFFRKEFIQAQMARLSA
jgi:hypothetical protein